MYMKSLTNKRILLGISGGIAAYKSADLVRRLREQGAEVQIVMTRSACEFITPLTMQALSGRPVHTELLDHDSEAGMGHIELARWSDVILIAPASANFIARVAQGMADDLLTALCLATEAPMLIAPAMNRGMWLNQATQTNIKIIEARGIKILGPAEGEQACGETGPGRMLEPMQLLYAVESAFHSSILNSVQVVVTAGPTQESIDPVRFISNRSSGRMGFAIAQAAQEGGANVKLISGPVNLQPPERVHCVHVKTAEQMREAVLADSTAMDIFIAAAAVADYRCTQTTDQKIKKNDDLIRLTLEKNPDILAEIASLSVPPFTLGFAAETESVKDNALKKLRDKNVDMIAANKVGDGLGFESENNALDIFWPGGTVSLAMSSKDKIARQLINIVAEHFHKKNTYKTH